VNADVSLTRSKVKVRGHGAFELPKISEAVNAGGDDRSPLAGLSGCVTNLLNTNKCSFVQGATTFSKLRGPIPWSRLLYRTKYGWYTHFRGLQSVT